MNGDGGLIEDSTYEGYEYSYSFQVSPSIVTRGDYYLKLDVTYDNGNVYQILLKDKP